MKYLIPPIILNTIIYFVLVFINWNFQFYKDVPDWSTDDRAFTIMIIGFFNFLVFIVLIQPDDDKNNTNL